MIFPKDTAKMWSLFLQKCWSLKDAKRYDLRESQCSDAHTIHFQEAKLVKGSHSPRHRGRYPVSCILQSLLTLQVGSQ